MQHTLEEDHSPFYAKFSHPGQNKIIELCQRELAAQPPVQVFRHHPLPMDLAEQILALLPLSRQVAFQADRASLFIASPGYRHEVHIDRATVSINYGVSIRDDLCETRWYSNRDIEDRFPVQENDINRSIIWHEDLAKQPVQPLRSFTLKQGQAVVFNSSLYHEFDNSRSPHPRCILTLRLINKHCPFDFIKRVMFEDIL